MTRRSDARSVLAAFGLATVAALGASPAGAQESVGGATSSVVYGVDDRVDWYLIPSPSMQTLARQAIVAIVPTGYIDLANPGQTFPPFDDSVGTLDDYVTTIYAPLCSSERFAKQPSASSCSGTLIDDDLVLTAGHCAIDRTTCGQHRYVFDYLETGDGVLDTIDVDDVYDCAGVLVYEETESPHLDYAIIQLDRPVVGRTPASVRAATTALAEGTPLVVIGFPSGIPMKYDDGGSVIDASALEVDSFVANTDTFSGNSGSGVFTDDGTLVGILVSGEEDYVDGTCATVNVLSDAEAGEECTYAFHAIKALCDGGYPSDLCANNPAPVCGDGFCSGGEDAASCALDCLGDRCGDGVCSSTESFETCSFDCEPSVPTHESGCGCSLVGSDEARGASTLVAMLALGLLMARRAAQRRL
jgi:V8-like Glu-specific endopeptidase